MAAPLLTLEGLGLQQGGRWLLRGLDLRLDEKAISDVVRNVVLPFWNAYSFLFRHWKDHPQLREFRTRLQVVATLVPETERERHLEAFLEHSWDLFRETLYDEASADVEAYSFDLHDEADRVRMRAIAVEICASLAPAASNLPRRPSFALRRST